MKKNTPHTQFGVTSMGEKGQVVIPADIRAAFNFEKGEKIVVVARHGSITLFPASRFEEMTKKLTEIQNIFTDNK